MFNGTYFTLDIECHHLTQQIKVILLKVKSQHMAFIAEHEKILNNKIFDPCDVDFNEIAIELDKQNIELNGLQQQLNNSDNHNTSKIKIIQEIQTISEEIAIKSKQVEKNKEKNDNLAQTLKKSNV